MQTALIIILSILQLVFLNIFCKKKNFLIDNKSLSHKSFTSNDAIPLTGGFVILINYALYSTNYFIFFFFILIFILGIFSDLLKITSALVKFVIQVLIVFFFFIFFGFKYFINKNTLY